MQNKKKSKKSKLHIWRKLKRRTIEKKSLEKSLKTKLVEKYDKNYLKLSKILIIRYTKS